MDQTALIIKLIEANNETLASLQRNFQILNDHSGESAIAIAGLAVKVDILMWITSAVALAILGILVERLATVLFNRRNNHKP